MANSSTQPKPQAWVSGNTTRERDLSPGLRQKIMGAHECGVSVPFIMKQYKLSRGAVRSTIDHDGSRTNQESCTRPGPKKSFSKLDERNILRHAREFPAHTYLQIIEATGVKCSKKTVSRILKSHDIVHWRCAIRAQLTKKAGWVTNFTENSNCHN